MSHIKTLEIAIDVYTFSLEIDTEDPENLVIESVTAIDGPIKSDTDMDPDIFTDDFMTDEIWLMVREKLGMDK